MEKENEISEEKETKLEEKQEEIAETEEVEEKHEEKLEEIKEEVESETEIKNKEIIEVKEEIKEPSKKTNKRLFIILPIVIITALVLSTIFAIMNMNNNNIIKGVYIEDIDVSDLSKDEVSKLIKERLAKIENLEFSYKNFSEAVLLEDLDIEININDAINKALYLGRQDNIIIDNFNILKSMLFKTKIDIDIKIDEEKFEEVTKNLQAEIPEKIEQYSYTIKDKELIITNGKAGNSILDEELKDNLIENIKNQINGIKEVIEIPVEYKQPEKIDLEKIYKEIYKEAKDAYIVDEPFELHKEEDGVNFAITMQEAKNILIEEKETYKIPLKITEPKVKVKDLGDKLFKQTLSKYTTIYDAGVYNRAHNVQLAAKTINGTILLPGETFSYNGVLGNTNAARGYKQATAYVGGKVVPSFGGGICQVSSTLYNAVLYANLEIVERHNHSYAVSYVPAGRDATVAYGGKDFKFKNSRSYPIKIVASAKNGIVSISIKGIKETKEYEVVLTSSVLSTKANTTTYEENSSLEVGKEKVIQAGYTGKTSVAYKILKYNGKTISKTLLSKDVYKPMNRIIERGTKPVVNTTTTETSTTVTTQIPETNISSTINTETIDTTI